MEKYQQTGFKFNPMNILIQDPPYGVRQKCEKRFDLTGLVPVWTFGGNIYNPFNSPLDDYLIAHETTHIMQQGNDAYGWWDDYLLSDKFRFKQELEAYRVQYRVFKDTQKDKNAQVRYLVQLSQDLSSALYGNLTLHSNAFKLIKEGM